MAGAKDPREAKPEASSHRGTPRPAPEKGVELGLEQEALQPSTGRRPYGRWCGHGHGAAAGPRGLPALKLLAAPYVGEASGRATSTLAEPPMIGPCPYGLIDKYIKREGERGEGTASSESAGLQGGGGLHNGDPSHLPAPAVVEREKR